MATTESRTGFRLPWSSEDRSDKAPVGRSADEATSDEATTAVTEATSAASAPTEEAIVAGPEAGSTDAQTEGQADTTNDAEPADNAQSTVSDSNSKESSVDSTATETPAPSRSTSAAPVAKKPTKFVLDLSRAMQAAAEESRAQTLGQFQADAKTFIENIHLRSAGEATDLRKRSDDDISGIQDWSKAEIARIREETEAKITQRKAQLETEIEQHAGLIEREIDAVQKTVAEFEEEMASFFERLIAEQDPSRFATMAENLPEPPTFEGLSVAPTDEPATTDETVAEVTDGLDVADAATDTTDAAIGKADEATAETTTDVEAVTGDEADTTDATDVTAEPMSVGSAQSFEGGESMDGEIDREAAFAAIQAAAEAAASAEVAADAAARAEAVADVAIEIMGNHEDEEADPRFAALGISPDYDAAEAEALAAAGSSDEEIPEIGNDALAARLAGLVPGRAKSGSGETAATQVVVVGLVSVASIASFKRHLGRLTGVQSVGVSSGPDGEFIFAVSHSGDIVLKEAIPSLPSFQARVTGSSDGVVQVTAHDPEGDA